MKHLRQGREKGESNRALKSERVAALEQQLRGMDDVVAQRCLLVLNLTNIQHEQSRADIEQLISAGRLAREDINKLTDAAKEFRAVLRQG